jgi:hypothetical protein
MLRNMAVALIPVMLVATPAVAVTSQEKMETCKIGAESQQLDAAKRSAFIKKCMAKGNYEPAARKNVKQTAPKQPKPQ